MVLAPALQLALIYAIIVGATGHVRTGSQKVMVAMLASDTSTFLAALERGQMLILLGVTCRCTWVGRNVAIRLAVEFVPRLAILRVYVQRLLKALVGLVMI